MKLNNMTLSGQPLNQLDVDDILKLYPDNTAE